MKIGSLKVFDIKIRSSRYQTVFKHTLDTSCFVMYNNLAASYYFYKHINSKIFQKS